MQFTFPIFLVAGLSLLIPLLIHLFNLRRYKTVFFPHTRFLKNLQLHSRKQSQVRYKWLMAARMLFLALLVLAFAQPFFKSSSNSTANTLVAVYIDNSPSMSLRNGQRSLLDIAKENALHLLQYGNGKFLVLSNDKPYSYLPVNRTQAEQAIRNIGLSSVSKTSTQILSELQGMAQGEKTDFYYLSDFQQYAFTTAPEQAQLKDIQFNGVKISGTKVQNAYIDTAYFETPVLQSNQGNKLVVRTRYFGEAPENNSVLQLSVDGVVKSAASPVFTENKEHYDTLAFQVSGNGWQKLQLTLNDPGVHFDDTFIIAARSSPEMSVLVLNESVPNVFLQAALRSYAGFKVTEAGIGSRTEDISAYNLILLNGATTLDEELAGKLQQSLLRGQNVGIFPGRQARLEAMNTGLQQLADVRISGWDTAGQTVAGLQNGSRLIRDMFEQVPENVQLPYASHHYILKAGLSAGQQSIFSFRNGDPFFAQYSSGKGQLYLCATPIDPSSGNFQSSYFFVPFLYQMASLAKGNTIFAITAGQKEPLFVSRNGGNEQNLLHLRSGNMDAIPPQRAEGLGV
ncbi:MAG TPA: BatA domain-containing protein, partial [Chitinophagaceae bacterium]|nr:BatA domain-containing protein [Chitinophagaceae bacterium]